MVRCIRALSVILLIGCGPSGSRGGGDAGSDPACIEGQLACDGNVLQKCSGGELVTSEVCPMACAPEIGCVTCVPGTGTCNGDMSTVCLPDGSGYVDEYCDPVMGLTCDPSSGACVGACSASTLGASYIGCEYYATVTSQIVNSSFQFAVAISNTTMAAATVTIEGGALSTPTTLTVMPGEVATQRLPWVPALKTCNSQTGTECGPPQQWGALAVGGGYRIRSTQPVTVYQFSPLDYRSGSAYSYANDASLLLPTNAWSTSYYVPAWQTWTPSSGTMPGILAVTAAHDGTTVTITSRANTTGGNGAPSFTAGSTQSVTLNKGSVLQLMSSSGDLTGSFVSSDKPVQVIGGHHCTQVPIGYTACDHLEESIFPVSTLADRYLVTPPQLGSGPRQQIIRIVATEADTSVTLDPAVGGPYTFANPGDFVEIPLTNQSFQVMANKKVIVAQYMVSQNVPGGNNSGDPAMALAVPTAQYRTNYLFHAPTNYTTNYVNITAPMGADVVLDGTSVPAASYTPIGNSGFGVARVQLSNTGNGTHTATSAMPFGISVYGYGSYTSYWYPGGLDLEPIVIQ